MNGTSTTLLNISHLFTRTIVPTATQVESLLYSYAANKSLADIKKLHAHLITSGLLTPWESRYIPALLASGYALSGHVPYARQLFDKLHQRTKRAYNSMIKLYTEKGLPYNALEMFVEMHKSGETKPDRLTYPFVVKSCSELSMLQFGLSIHGLILHSGVDSNTFVGNSLLSMYISFGKKDEAQRVFDNMHEKGVVSWNTLISGYFKTGCPNESLTVFNKMVDLKVDIDIATIVSILPTCAYLKELETGRKIHHLAKKNNLYENLFVRNALIDMYLKCGQMEDARIIFNETSQRDVVTWTSMINGYIVNGDTKTAISLCQLMNHEGHVNPNAFTLASLLSACADLNHLKHGKTLHQWAIKNNLETDVNVETGLIDMYAKCNFITYTFRTFNKTSKTKTAPWNAVLSGSIQNGLYTNAIMFFKQMRFLGVGPNEATIKCILPAYAITTDLNQVTNFHSYLITSGFLSKNDLATGLIDIYAKSGALKQAYTQFTEIPLKDRDIVLWSVVISGYGKHGNGEGAVTLFNQMIESKVTPNEVTFTSILHACSHSGLVEDGLRLFKMMQDYEIAPRPYHYACVVDLLGRAGRVEEAYEMIVGMRVAPNCTVWGALLGACAVHEKVELGEVAAKRLFEMEPENTGNYVMMGNIYAAVGRWEEAENVRNLMSQIGLKKSPGHSFI